MEKRVLFVDVDTQEDFSRADGRLSVPGAEALLPALGAVTDAARARGARVLASADAHTADDPEFAVFPPHCVEGTDGQRKVAGTVVDGAVTIPASGEGLVGAAPQVVLEKRTFSLFSNPAAERILEAERPELCVVYGVATDYCVRATALDAVELGYDATLVVDGARPVELEPGDGQRAIDEMGAAGVTLV